MLQFYLSRCLLGLQLLFELDYLLLHVLLSIREDISCLLVVVYLLQKLYLFVKDLFLLV